MECAFDIIGKPRLRKWWQERKYKKWKNGAAKPRD